MVAASNPAYIESTLAARPVGAISTKGMSKSMQVCTKAATKVVLPVPAYPLSKKVARSVDEPKKVPNLPMASSCWGVGTCVNASFMAAV